MSAGIQNERAGQFVLEQRASKKVFALEDILSVATGLLLSPSGTAGVHDLVAFLAETEPSPENTALYISGARAGLEEQLPFLRQLDLRGLYERARSSPWRMDAYTGDWASMQSHLYGEEHQLFSLSRWRRIKSSHKL